MKTRIILLAAAFATACTTQNNSALVITSVVPAKEDTKTSSTTPPVTTTTCTFDPAASEVSFVQINLSQNDGTMGAVVHNFMPPTNSANSLNLDAAVFEAHQAVIRVEFPSGAPAGVSVPNPLIVPVSGVISSGEVASIPVPLLPKGVISGTVPDKTFIRTSFHLEGKLIGGSTVRTTEREFIFQACTTDPACPVNACL
ncbi:MAG TPA: hypothetical protein VI356_21155 [Myxococcales bacterium]